MFAHTVLLCCRWQILAAGRECWPEPLCGKPTHTFLAVLEDMNHLWEYGHTHHSLQIWSCHHVRMDCDLDFYNLFLYVLKTLDTSFLQCFRYMNYFLWPIEQTFYLFLSAWKYSEKWCVSLCIIEEQHICKAFVSGPTRINSGSQYGLTGEQWLNKWQNVTCDITVLCV